VLGSRCWSTHGRESAEIRLRRRALALLFLLPLLLCGCSSSGSSAQRASTTNPRVVRTTPHHRASGNAEATGTTGSSQGTFRAAGGARGRQGAIAVAEKVLRYDFKGQYGRAWDLLAPAQQAVVSRRSYQRCQQPYRSPAKLDEVKAVGVSKHPLHLAGIAGQRVNLVILRFKSSARDQTVTATVNFYVISIGRDWRWLLDRPSISSYSSGSCPEGG
jgi:hypothetical protein